jgi:hypothetical protein
MSLFDLVIWLFAPSIQIAILFMMAKRKLRDNFPVFFTYTVFQVITNIALLAIYQLALAHYASSYTYFYAYWTINALSAVLGFMIVHEMFSYAMRPYVGLRDMAHMVFQWTALVMLLVSAVIAFSTQGSNLVHITAAILTLERCVRLLQCAMCLFMVCCSSYLGLSWKSFPIGVSFGFALVASSNLFMLGMHYMFSENWMGILTTVFKMTYNVTVLLWLGYCLSPQSMKARTELLYRPAIDRWNQTALAIQHAGGAGIAHDDVPATYISDIEHAVDRALKNSINH